jgi:hypothetical protein
MHKHRFTASLSFDELDPAAPRARACDHPNCDGSGEYRAPKGRDRLNDYYWFCLEHVRAYNRAWDFYAGMTADQIEAHVRNDTTWQRPSWPMGDWRARERAMRERAFSDAFGADWSGEAAQAAPSRPRTPEEEALAVLDLQAPVEFSQIKSRYRELVKQHHPDTHGGDKAAEETLKRINQAYNTLKAAFGAT